MLEYGLTPIMAPQPSSAKPQPGTISYVAPFAVFIGVLGLAHLITLPVQIAYPARTGLALVAWLIFSRNCTPLKPSFALASIGAGIAVFVIWIAPDALFHYRHSWIFENSLTGRAAEPPPPGLRHSLAFLCPRVVGSALVVPVAEELFWRGWLMRWLINVKFQKIPLGTYRAGAFWITALLFASEHGAFWEVGLAAGIIYNWWLIRTRNLADCILAHAVTNAALAAYVVAAGQWQYWL